MESEKQNTQIVMAILGMNGKTTVDELTAICDVINFQNVTLSKFEVQRILDRGVLYGFVRKNLRKYSLNDRHETDGGKRKPKQSKAARKANKEKKHRKSERRSKRKSMDTPERPKISESAVRDWQAEKAVYAENIRPGMVKMRRDDRRTQPDATVMRRIGRREIRDYQPRRINYTEENTGEMSD